MALDWTGMDEVEQTFSGINSSRRCCYSDETYEDAKKNARVSWDGHDPLQEIYLARAFMESGEFIGVLVKNPGCYVYFNAVLGDRFKDFVATAKTVAGAWDMLCECDFRDKDFGASFRTMLMEHAGLPSRDRNEKACDALSMLAEYALESDRMKLLKVFSRLLAGVKATLPQPFHEIADILLTSRVEKDDILLVRQIVEDFAKKLEHPHLDELGESGMFANMPKPERVKIKNDIQNAKLASAFLIMCDAVLCESYAHGKLMLFWRLLSSYAVAEGKGTFIKDYITVGSFPSNMLQSPFATIGEDEMTAVMARKAIEWFRKSGNPLGSR